MLVGKQQVLFRPRREALLALQLGKFELTARDRHFAGSAAHRTAALGVQQELADALDLRIEGCASPAAEAKSDPTSQSHADRGAAHQGVSLGAVTWGAATLGAITPGAISLGVT